MTLTVPPRSLPPPVLPPKVVAQTRIKALEADLAAEQRPLQRAALSYEIAALSELRLEDAQAATQRYEAAHAQAPAFRPALFALARRLRQQQDHAGVARVLRALVTASPAGRQRAAALVELACLQLDHLADPASGRSLLHEACAQDPEGQTALLLLEAELRAAVDPSAVAAIVARRADAVADPRLRALLLCESARAHEAAGNVDAAVQQLLRADALPSRRASSLLQLWELARKHDAPLVCANAAGELAAILQRSVSDERSDAAAEWIAKLPEATDRALLAGYFYREAGRGLSALSDDPEAAARAYAEADKLLGDDGLLTLERLDACDAAGDNDTARALAQAALGTAQGQRACALHFQLAEIAQRAGDPAAARASLLAALEHDPDSPAALAVYEDALLDAGELHELCDHLEARAARSEGSARMLALARAASLAGERAQDPARALRLYRQLLREGADPQIAARELYAAAVRYGDKAAQAQAAAQLLELPLSDAERSALARGHYAALLGAQDLPSAKLSLLRALEDPACADWAAYTLRVVSALHHDHARLAHAHAVLGNAASDVELSAAHACAQARALLRTGDSQAAAERLRAALELSPTNGYAVALLEEILLARGETAEAVHVLREAAAAEQNARAGELSLLHAGAAAETSGQVELAARSYEEAIDRDNTALSPLWALRRLGERSGQPQLLLSALEGLALREAAADLAGVANLELAERYDSIGKPELAIAPLEATLVGTALAFEAAVALTLLPRNSFDAELRPRALSLLAHSLSRDARADFERELIAETWLTMPEQASQALDLLQANEAPAHSDALMRLFLCRDENERAGAFAALGKLSSDPSARSELRLHAVRTASLGRGAPAADALMSALAMLEQAPESLSAALALDEALSVADDAEVRLQALRARLEHAAVSGKLSLAAALARALQAAGHHKDAADWARAVLESEPADLSAWEVLRVAARATSDFETVVLACDTLAYHADGEARAVLLEEAATVLEEELGRPADAELRLRAALAADESRTPVFERLHDLLLERRDLEALSALISSRVRVAATEGERIDLLYEQARLLRALGEREATLACLEEVLAIEPSHAGALGLGAETHASQKDWGAAVEMLRLLAAGEVPASQKRLARQGAADFLERNLQDSAGAYRELAELAKLGLADLTIWKRMAQLAQRAQLDDEAIAAWTSAAELSTAEQRASYERAAAELLETRKGDLPSAANAYRRALAASPVDIDACEHLCGLLDTPGERNALVSSFTATLLAAVARRPAEESLLRALTRVAVLAQDKTLEHTALEALAVLGMTTPAELEELEALTTALPELPSGALDEADFAQLVPSVRSAPAQRFATLICKAWLDANDDVPARHGVDKQARVKRKSEHPVRNALAKLTQAFGLSIDELYVGGEDPRALTMLMTKGRKQSWISGAELRAPLDATARFRVAQQAAAMRTLLSPLSLRSKSDARDLLRAGLLCVAPNRSLAGAAQLAPLAEQLGKRLSRGERRELAELLHALPEPDNALQQVVDDARDAARRAGLLACGSLRVALSLTLAEHFDAAVVASDPAALSLLRCWCSGTALTLRRKLGLAL